MGEPVLDERGGGTITTPEGTILWASRRLRHGEAWIATSPVVEADDESSAYALAVLVDAVVRRASADGIVAVHWESDDPAPVVDAVAGRVGLPAPRDVLQLRRPLPLEPPRRRDVAPIVVRPLRPGTADEEAWVRCNNRAFATHPDQGHESQASLREAMAWSWFDPAGFLLLDGDPGVDEDGELDGFCWTKTHPPSGPDPALGEIYVIGVDPRASGRGLGRALVIAGLGHLTDRGLGTAVLYLDADNAPARRLYHDLGFTLHHTRRVRSRRVDAAQPTE